MSDNYAAWAGWESAETASRLNPSVGDYGAAAAVEAPAVSSGPVQLPPGVLRRQAAADVAERRQERDRARAAEARRERAHDEALALYRAQAEARGEVVSAMDIATGQVAGRSLGDIFGDAVAAADHEDARVAARQHREAGLELEHVMVGRSDGWPQSPYEADRMIRRAEELHRDLVMFEARQASRRGRFEEHKAAVSAERKQDASCFRDTSTPAGVSRQDVREYRTGSWPVSYDSYGREISR